MRETIKKEMTEIISNLTGIAKENIDSTSDFTVEGIDSFAVVEVVFAIENKYEIDIPQDRLMTVRNMDSLIDLVEELLKAKKT